MMKKLLFFTSFLILCLLTTVSVFATDTKCAIIFDTKNVGTLITSNTNIHANEIYNVNKDTVITLPNLNVPENKIFNGWQSHDALYKANTSYTVTENTTFTAVVFDVQTGPLTIKQIINEDSIVVAYLGGKYQLSNENSNSDITVKDNNITFNIFAEAPKQSVEKTLIIIPIQTAQSFANSETSLCFNTDVANIKLDNQATKKLAESSIDSTGDIFLSICNLGNTNYIHDSNRFNESLYKIALSSNGKELSFFGDNAIMPWGENNGTFDITIPLQGNSNNNLHLYYTERTTYTDTIHNYKILGNKLSFSTNQLGNFAITDHIYTNRATYFPYGSAGLEFIEYPEPGNYTLALKPKSYFDLTGKNVFIGWQLTRHSSEDFDRNKVYKQGETISRFTGSEISPCWRTKTPNDTNVIINPDEGIVEVNVANIKRTFNKEFEEVLIAGEKIILPNSGNKPGYSLDYWTLNGEKLNNNIIILGSEDIMINAVWQKDNSNIENTTPNGGSSSSSGGGGGSSKPATSPNRPDTAKPDTTTSNIATANNINQTFADVSSNAWYAEYVTYVYNKGMMKGTENGNFEPNAKTTRGMIVTMLYRLDGKPNASNVNFSDVQYEQWFSNAVAWASANGVVNGYSDGTFAPNGDITREQLAAILYRYAQAKGYDVSSKGNVATFSDSNKISGWANDCMQWAVGCGLMNGDNGALRSQGTATRAEVAAMLMRFCENIAK